MMRIILPRLLAGAALFCLPFSDALAQAPVPAKPGAASPTSPSKPMLPSPLPAHPRLFASPADWDALKARIATDPVSARIFASLKTHAEMLLTEPTLTRKMEGRRLLHVSRDCLERVSTLAMVSLVTGDERYTKRAVEEMKAIAAFPDWNPSHFLDVGEMALGLAIGYDWLYHKMSPEDRTIILRALYDKGVGPTWAGKDQPHWVLSTNNWNQVCEAGITIAALAIAEDYPEIAEKTLRRAVDNLGRCTGSYAPDGAYAEGPMYWGYGTSFHVTLLSAVQHLTGQAFGMDAYPGFDKSGDYMMQMSTPTGQFFCYSDCRPRRGFVVGLFWYAGRYERPDLVGFELENLEKAMSKYDKQKQNAGMRLLPLTLFWWKPELKNPATPPAPEPLHWLGRGPVPVAVHRSAWSDPNALYAAIKGGHPGYSHGHMDEGSFILESDGVQWATDLGMEEYHALESIGVNLWNGAQNGQRWKIFRLGPDSHNILRFNGQHQNITGKAEIVRFSANGPQPHTVVDLTPSYPKQVASVQRGLAMLDGKAFLIQDEWKTLPAGGEDSAPVTVDWQMLTLAEKATVSDDKRSVVLTKKGKTLTLCVLSPEKLEIQVQDAEKPRQPYDAQNPGAKMVILRTVTDPGMEGHFTVLAVPGSSGPAADFPRPVSGSVLDWSKPLPPSK
ncbi:MAG: heparinase II/III family protein [Candidatus Methylacidiphilales bacterium]